MNFLNRMSDDRGDAISVSFILWIALVVVLVLGVGGLIYKGVMDKAKQVQECINKSNLMFESSEKCK